MGDSNMDKTTLRQITINRIQLITCSAVYQNVACCDVKQSFKCLDIIIVDIEKTH